jgi:hypothetical protein
MNTFMNAMNDVTNFTYTENGGITHKTTRSDLLDMFAMGAAYRNRSDADVINLFKNAYLENPVYALKCLFYIRDVRGGQGERRFFRVCMHWLANADVEAARRNLIHVPEFGRWDDLYEFVGTRLEDEAFKIMKHQLALDVQCKTPSLLAKWLKSENTSSEDSRILGRITRNHFNMTARQYRKTLSVLRQRINVLERLMSENRWDEIEFDKIPSRAGMIYKNAFARHDLERAKNENVQTYAEFAKDTTKKVNAKTLYPYECVAEALKLLRGRYYWQTTNLALDDTNRLMVNKYWDNLTDYFNNASFNGIAVVDTSGSMVSSAASAPINVAISLGMYCAEHNHGPFANHYISFSSRPQMIRTDGMDFCDKVERIYRTNLCENTNIEATFDLLLNVATRPGVKKEDIPKNVIVISDMEFDSAVNGWSHRSSITSSNVETVLEGVARKWAQYGLELPHLIFWNVDARQNNIPMLGNGRASFVSGFSPSIFETIMSGKTGYDLMMEKLNTERYACIQ